MSWHVYRIFRVIALCALFGLHSALIGIISVAMLASDAGAYEALQFTMDIIVLFTIFCFSVWKYARRNAVPSRTPNMIAFSALLILSFVGAIGLTVRAGSRNGKGLCEDFTSSPSGGCTNAALAITFTWLAVAFAGMGLVISWLDKGSGTGSWNGQYDWEDSTKELYLPKEYQHSTFRSTHSHVKGPTDSYIPRPRDPYDTPRRKRSTRSHLHQTAPRRASSGKAPVPPLPPLPSFNPLEVEPEPVPAAYVPGNHRSRSKRHREPREDLPDLPPPTRRPPKNPQRETQNGRRVSPTDLYAQLG